MEARAVPCLCQVLQSPAVHTHDVLPQDVPTYSDVEEHMLRTAAAGSAQDASATVQWRREVRTRLADIGTPSRLRLIYASEMLHTALSNIVLV